MRGKLRHGEKEREPGFRRVWGFVVGGGRCLLDHDTSLKCICVIYHMLHIIKICSGFFRGPWASGFKNQPN
jgi:hypothetical protein